MPGDPTAAERAVVVQLLGRARAVTPAALYAAIRTATPAAIDAAVSSLAEAGVIHCSARGSLSTTPAVRRLDELGLVSL